MTWQSTGEPLCECTHTAGADGTVTVEADACPAGDPRLVPDCRVALLSWIGTRSPTRIVIRRRGTERWLEGEAARFLAAAAAFARRIRSLDRSLAERTLRDPLAAAEAAAGRAGRVGDIAAELGFPGLARIVGAYDSGLQGLLGPTVADVRIQRSVPEGAIVEESVDLGPGSSATIYEVPGRETARYHLAPAATSLGLPDCETLARAREHLATQGAEPSAHRAVEAARRPDTTASVDHLATVLRKHLEGFGVIEDCFSDPAVTDVLVSSPAAENRLRVRRGDRVMHSNVRFTPDGAAAMASRLRRTSGRPFSRAAPTIDARVALDGPRDRIRAAGVGEPAAEGYGFAFRAHDGTAWTLPGLVENGTLPARTAGVMSVAVERGAAVLVAGARGAGKTTLLGALLWELPAAVRSVVIEDTPELPVDALRRHGRDVQAIRTDPGDGSELSPSAALRTALRLGESALVVGEVRGPEARTLYEAMRIGASGNAVLGTVHGDRADGVRRRLVDELEVPSGAFGATDLVVTMGRSEGSADGRVVRAVEECFGEDGSAADLCTPGTDRLDRGNSRVVPALAAAAESYRDVLEDIDTRGRFLSTLAEEGRTSPEAVCTAHTERRERNDP